MNINSTCAWCHSRTGPFQTGERGLECVDEDGCASRIPPVIPSSTPPVTPAEIDEAIAKIRRIRNKIVPLGVQAYLDDLDAAVAVVERLAGRRP